MITGINALHLQVLKSTRLEILREKPVNRSSFNYLLRSDFFRNCKHTIHVIVINIGISSIILLTIASDSKMRIFTEKS